MVQPSRQVKDHLLEGCPDAAGEVGVGAGPRFVGSSGLDERAEIDRFDGETAVGFASHQATKLGEEYRRPMGSHGHDLVLVRGKEEPQGRCDRFVEEPERVWELLGRQDGQLAADRRAREMGRGLPGAVEHQDAAIGERGGKAGRRRVSHMVGHESPDRGVQSGQRGLKKRRRRLGVERSQWLPAVTGDLAAGRGQEGRVARVRHRIQIGPVDVGPLQAPPRRLLRQLPRGKWLRTFPVLAPAETILPGGGNDLAIDDDGADGSWKIA